MSTTFAIGQYLRFLNDSSDYRFQNFYINQTTNYDDRTGYVFVPFGFSGITVSRQGDNIDANLVFPNNSLTRPWATTAIDDRWVAYVDTVRLDPSDSSVEPVLLYSYVGQVATGGWDPTTVNLRLNSVLDAVTRGVPHRVLNQSLCGPLPVTSNVRV